jgi:hypothetical protein
MFTDCVGDWSSTTRPRCHCDPPPHPCTATLIAAVRPSAVVTPSIPLWSSDSRKGEERERLGTDVVLSERKMGDRDTAASGGLTNGGQEADAGTAPPPARDPPAAMHARDGAPGACPSLLYPGDVRSVEVYATSAHHTHTHRHTDAAHTAHTLSSHTTSTCCSLGVSGGIFGGREPTSSGT